MKKILEEAKPNKPQKTYTLIYEREKIHRLRKPTYKYQKGKLVGKDKLRGWS